MIQQNDFLKWKPIDAGRAIRAIAKGAVVFPLPSEFYSGGATYGHAIETKRGARYLVSNFVLGRIVIPEGMLPDPATKPTQANHRSPFGPGA